MFRKKYTKVSIEMSWTAGQSGALSYSHARSQGTHGARNILPRSIRIYLQVQFPRSLHVCFYGNALVYISKWYLVVTGRPVLLQSCQRQQRLKCVSHSKHWDSVKSLLLGFHQLLLYFEIVLLLFMMSNGWNSISSEDF